MIRTAIASVAICLCVAAVTRGAKRGDPDKGNEIFDEQCGSCHDAYSTDRKVGPGLKWLFSKDKLDSNGKPVNEANVLDKIDTGGKGMPAYRKTLGDDDKADLLAYLKTL